MFYNNKFSREDVPNVKLFKQDTLFMVPDKFEIIMKELLTDNRKAEFEIEEYLFTTTLQNSEDSIDKKSGWNIVGITLGV